MNITKSLVVAALAAFATPVVTVAAVPSTATQNVPGTMNYQGYLADPSTGTAYVDGIYTLDIRIWNSPADKTGCLWGGKYTVYVKGGYFNLMLGDPSATALTAADGTLPTYANADLWKALWDNGSDNVRYLGVTMRQDASHATVSSPVEIAPRQQLLTSPFAFRAQRAQYADQSVSDFSVPGKLTVSGGADFSGTVTMPAGSSVGPLVANSSQVKLTGNTSPTASQPSVYDVGRYLYFYSYYDMSFAPTSGNIFFNVPSGKKMQVTSAGSFVSDVPVNTIGGTGATTLGGSGVTTVKGSSVTVVPSDSSSGSKVLVDRNYVTIQGDLSIHGRGPVYWGDKGVSSGVKPFVYKTVTITIPANGNYYNYTLDTSTYKWSVVGWSEVSGYLIPSGNRLRALDCTTAGGTPVLGVSLSATTASAVKINVHLLGISKHFVDDQR